MPIYSFKCEFCGMGFDKYMPKYESDDKPITVACPKCGRLARRVFSAFGFRIKGGGAVKAPSMSEKVTKV